eukprot:TRINITY_DN6342_c0_g1_i1.p1 TRINITY_DN6342_c0_g1~~TRINITY_DN6342_c0_g1_i1.p1  ORF type:complete len:539 (-),score=157.15 TRINITY_DN6342_c0_g1_i1:13-1629(-)
MDKVVEGEEKIKENVTGEKSKYESESKSTEPEGEKPKTRLLKEGKGEIIVSANANEVFYNPAQATNRDFSVLMIRTFDEIRQEEMQSGEKKLKKQNEFSPEGLKILEALSASGLRSIRYFKEIPRIKQILANDFDATAVENIKRNILHNQISLDSITPSHSDACMVMYQNREKGKRFDVVDLDPYGSPAVFLDSAVQSVADGGLLCVTCTDVSVLCGNHPEVCYTKYGSIPLKTPYSHEMALRIVLTCIESHASRYKRYIVPLVSLSIDFYVRIFVRVYTSADEGRRSASKQGYVFQCTGCDTFHLQPMAKTIESGNSKRFIPPVGPTPPAQNCEFCNRRFHMGGPFWTAPLCEPKVLQRLIDKLKAEVDQFQTGKRLLGMLIALSEEMHEYPFFYSLASLSNTLHLCTPSMIEMRSALITAGYRVSRSHTEPLALKTNCPPSVIWDVMRSWHKKNPAKNIKPNSPAAAILNKEPTLVADFTEKEEAKESTARKFFPNPEDNWGPMARAKRKRDDKSECENAEKKQDTEKKENETKSK